MSPETSLALATTLSIVVLILLITWAKIHPFLSLIVASVLLGLTTGLAPNSIMAQFAQGFGDVMKSVGIVVGLGTMLGGILIQSGGANRFATALISLAGKKAVPWALFLAALLIGLPLFFEVGFVLLVPLAFTIAKKMNESIFKTGLPLLAGLSIAHGLVPPHPAPMMAVASFHADAGKTILLALLIGLPVGLISGPLFVSCFPNWIKTKAPKSTNDLAENSTKNDETKLEPPLWAVTTTILLPPVLMMVRSIATASHWPETLSSLINFLGDPISALFIALVFAILVLGIGRGSKMDEIRHVLEKSLIPVAGILLIVGAGGGFKQVLIAVKIGHYIGLWAAQAHVSVLLLGWLAAAVVRIATGSATVATFTAVGIVAPIAETNPHVSRELLVLATGAGSLILSHVNDAGFWLVKEYFGLSLVDTFKSWTLMETMLSVLGLIFVLVASSW